MRTNQQPSQEQYDAAITELTATLAESEPISDALRTALHNSGINVGGIDTNTVSLATRLKAINQEIMTRAQGFKIENGTITGA